MSISNRSPIAITGFGWEIPQFGPQPSLSEAFEHGVVDHPVFEPELKLGKRGLRYKERATLMALCASKTALQHAQWIDDTTPVLNANDFGVVVASNTGNLDTVCHAAQTIRQAHVNATSSMDLPNASSNVVASTIAIRFGLKAMNLMICSGASASLDALILAANAIRNGRAQRMLVCTVETDGSALRSLLAQRRVTGDEGESPMLEGAGVVILESLESAKARGARIHGLLSDYVFTHADAASQQPLYGLLDRHHQKAKYLPATSFVKLLAGLDAHAIDLGGWVVKSYGSTALLQLIHACEQSQRIPAPPEAGGVGHGAIVFGGGTWNDRRAGALVVESSRSS